MVEGATGAIVTYTGGAEGPNVGGGTGGVDGGGATGGVPVAYGVGPTVG